MQEHLRHAERLPGGLLRHVTLDGSARRMHQKPVGDWRLGQLRATDLRTVIDTGSAARPSGDSAVLGPCCPAAISAALPAGRSSDAAEWVARSGSSNMVEELSARQAVEVMRSAASSRSADAPLLAVVALALRSGPWDGASISARLPGGGLEPAASSEHWAAELDQWQLDLGEGPCLDAVRPPAEGPHADLIVADDLASDHRWPRWDAAATATGIRAVLVLRLFTDHTVGCLSMYSRRSGAVDDSRVLEQAQVVAGLVSVMLAQACTERGLLRAVHSRGLIGQAQGMLMQRYGLTADSAFGVLRRCSQQHNTKLVVLAERLTTTGNLPDLG